MAGEGKSATFLVAVAHPDDESFGCGALIAAAAQAGHNVVLVCASRGELGEDASGRHPDPESLGRAREAELRRAAEILGVSEVVLLGYTDSGWDGEAGATSILTVGEQLTRALEEAISMHAPDVVVTLDPTGSDGHRDHAAVGAAATEAFQRAAPLGASLYHWCLPRSLMLAWSREIAAQRPGSVYLETELGRDDGDVTTILDGAHVLDIVDRAMAVHATQTSPYSGISPDLTGKFVRYDYLVRQVPAPGPDSAEVEDRLTWGVWPTLGA